MIKLLNKEIKLASSPLSFLFLVFACMTFIPQYPILVGAFFVSFGLFHSFQAAREADDIHYSVLLPIAKKDIVTSKYIFSVTLEITAFFLNTVFTILRMTVLKDAAAYQTNVMMFPNPVYLAFVLIIFAEFNYFFIRLFFKTAYYFGKPFVIFAVMTFLTVGIGETLHHIPGLSFLNSAESADLPIQLIILLCGILVYAVVTLLSWKASMKSLETIDL